MSASRSERHDAFRRRSASDDPRLHPLESGEFLLPAAGDGASAVAGALPPADEDLYPVTSAPILAQHYADDDADSLSFSYRYQRTEVCVEVHREPSNGSGGSRAELQQGGAAGGVAGASGGSGSRTASPPKLLETASRASSRTRHSVSLETVSPTERLAVSLDKRRVKSCESELHDYDRLEITQFHRGPFYNADYDVMSEGGSPELRSKVRYNDTGSFEEVNEEHMHLLDVVSSFEDVAMEDDDDTETLNGAQKYRELWNLRATFEEEEDFSDTIRMEDLTSPDDQSPEQEQATTSELTTSFESNTDPVAEQDEGPPPPPHDDGECEGNNCPPPGGGAQRRKSSSTLLIPQLSYESRRQNYRGILTRRGKTVEMPKANNDNSFDSMETDGDVSEDTSRHEVTTTSFESTTDNTDSTSEAQNPRKLQEMRGDSGYKSLETQQTLQGSTLDAQQSISLSSSPPAGPSPKPAKKHIQFTIEVEDPEEDVSTRGQQKQQFDVINTDNRPHATSPTAEGGLQRSPSQRKTLFERRTAKTASKKRREYGREKQAQYVYESVAAAAAAAVEAETDSRSDQQSGDSFDDGGGNGGAGGVTENGGGGGAGSLASTGKFSVFTRFFRSQKKKAAMHRDFSIDERTDALFQQFTRYDPQLDKHTLTVGRAASIAHGGGNGGISQAFSAATAARPRMHRRPTDPTPSAVAVRRRSGRDKLSLEVRSVSVDSDSTCSTDRRRSLAQDSIEEEEDLLLHPLTSATAHDDLEDDPVGGQGQFEVSSPGSGGAPPAAVTSRKESIIHDIPVIKLPEGELTDIC